jgi:predicted nucleic acid-binding protein
VILFDTSVVSAVLRRRRKGTAEEELTARVDALLRSDETLGIPGIVLQELLSGVADRAQRRRLLRAVQDGFPIVLATDGDHLKAADLMSACAAEGIAFPTPDALIAAQAINRRARLLTIDADFRRLPAGLGLRLA